MILNFSCYMQPLLKFFILESFSLKVVFFRFLLSIFLVFYFKVFSIFLLLLLFFDSSFPQSIRERMTNI